MFAIILIATLLAAGGASVNANPSGLGQIPNIVPADAAKISEGQSRALAVVIGNIFVEYSSLFENLEFYNLTFTYWIGDYFSVEISIERLELCGLSSIQLYNIDYVNNVLIAEVSVEKLTFTIDGAILNLYVFFCPITVCASGTIEIGIEKIFIKITSLNSWTAVEAEINLIISVCQSYLKAIVQNLNVDVSDLVNALFQVLAQISNQCTVFQDLLSTVLGDFINRLLKLWW